LIGCEQFVGHPETAATS